MASNKEAGRNDGVVRPETSKGNGRGDVERASASENEDIGRRVEEYLTSVERELTSNQNPRLTLERSRLLGLLESYKKLCDVYERRKKERKPPKDERTLEIYAVLYPELYEDLREKEKAKLRKNLVKGRTGGDGCTPRNFRLQTRVAVEDTRQKEKERFVRLVSSAPSAFHQGTAEKLPINRRRLLLASSSSRVQPKREDAREKEKERLAKILSSDLDNNPVFKRRFPSSAPAVKKPLNSAPAVAIKIPNNRREPAKIQIKPTFQLDRVDKGGGMVRRDAGRRSGVGTNQLERRNRLLSLTNKEHQHHLDVLEGRVSKKDKGVLARENSILDLSSEQQETVSRHRASPVSVSVSTQTDDRLSSPPPTSMLSPRITTEPVTENDQTKLFSVQKEPFITSPRAKLIKDLHGVSPCLPGASPLLTLPDQGVSEEKRKRCAYAEALKAQIDEKRRLEEEKRRKELEEDEHIERRAREQQHRLKQEWEREQSLRHDWLMQKEAQEESVRQKMAELELEAKELKRRERLRRGVAMSPDGGERPCSPGGGGFPSTPRQRLSPREVEQLLPQAMRDSMMTSLIMDKPRPKTLHLENNNNILLANQNNSEAVSVEAEGPPVLDQGMKQSSEESPGSNTNRPSSPVLPAVQTDSILRRSLYSSPRLELVQGEKEKDELLRGDRILTQLGVFRRELELEQERLEQRLYEQGSS